MNTIVNSRGRKSVFGLVAEREAKFIRLLVLFVLCFVSGCLRYVAPRSELEKQSSTETSGDASKLPPISAFAGKDEFLAFERRLIDRQQGFVHERQEDYSQLGDSAYLLGPGDVVTLTVFGFPDLSGDFQIAPDGSLSLPLVGVMQAGGTKLLALRNELSARYARYVRDPRIQVMVKDYQAEKVFVTGEVMRPGTYPLKRNGEQLLELIAEAGGRSERAGNRVIVVPQANAAAVASSNSAGTAGAKSRNLGVEFNADELTGTSDQVPLSIPLRNGDTVIVPEAGNFEVYGEVMTPGSFKLGGKTSALGAIAAAGGFTYSAKVDEVELIRDVGAGRKAAMVVNLEDIALKGVQDLRLRDGDILRVPSDSSRFARRQVVEVINSLFKGVGVNPR